MAILQFWISFIVREVLSKWLCWRGTVPGTSIVTLAAWRGVLWKRLEFRKRHIGFCASDVLFFVDEKPEPHLNHVSTDRRIGTPPWSDRYSFT